LVVGFLEDFFLQADKGFLPFAIQHGHVDVKNPRKAVLGRVLDAFGFPIGGLAHALCDRDASKGPARKYVFPDACHFI
jgi:hypothetical protein